MDGIDPYALQGKRTKNDGVLLTINPGVEDATEIDEHNVPPADTTTLEQAMEHGLSNDWVPIPRKEG